MCWWLHHNAFKAGYDPWLPSGLFSMCAEPSLGYQPDKCSVAGYIFQSGGPASKDIVGLWVQVGQGDFHRIVKQKWPKICPFPSALTHGWCRCNSEQRLCQGSCVVTCLCLLLRSVGVSLGRW